MKLFNKLNEQIKINELKGKEITEAESQSVEKKIIFEDLVKETKEKIVDVE